MINVIPIQTVTRNQDAPAERRISPRGSLRAIVTVAACTAVLASRPAVSADAPKRPPLILVHYMPWFVAKPVSPVWGWHWTMNAFDPEKSERGRRAIASHYYPLIGPYDSGDPDAIEYHLLLMKLAGIDGLVVDWYGLENRVDYPILHRNTAALFPMAAKVELKIAICYEDQTISKLVEAGVLTAKQRVPHAREVLDWLRTHWFAEPSYLRHDGRPVFLSFGASGLTDAEWSEALPQGPTAPLYLSEHHRRPAASGAFDWPVPKDGLPRLDVFAKESKGWPLAMPAAFPRFHDIYAEAKVHPTFGNIPDDSGRTFVATVTRGLSSGAPFLQIVTWNDWGEGTAIEPSREFAYRDLEALQRLRREHVDPAFAPRPEDLRLPHQLYSLRLQQRNRPDLSKQLDEISQRIAAGHFQAARETLEKVLTNTP